MNKKCYSDFLDRNNEPCIPFQEKLLMKHSISTEQVTNDRNLPEFFREFLQQILERHFVSRVRLGILGARNGSGIVKVLFLGFASNIDRLHVEPESATLCEGWR